MSDSIMPIPPAYHWLATIGVLPRMVSAALPFIGLHEGAGALNNPTILGWAAELGLGKVYTADSIAWCGLFMAKVAHDAGKAAPDAPLWALNWAKFGEEAGQPSLGDVLTFTRSGGGHVGMYIGEDATAYHVLGGNQGDQVSIVRILKIRLYRARRAIMASPPASHRPFVLAAAGALSTNEA